ncbi:hypothetical protein [Bradyrhizobium sp.]|uniref:hypothetical protein n=1 Tax=Bradyrhizobium sp. TaxID=376 RepID=UPI0025C016DD|nr:hypothetical protein [Bradyrhizobium sp.]
MRARRLGFLLICVASVIPVALPAYAAVVLITEEESKLPPLKGAVAADRRGITRGPKIEFIADSEPSHSPMHFQLKFVSYGGAKIDSDSIKFTYLKTPSVDLTDRVRPFVQATGIDIPDTQLPAGDHMLRVDIKDSDGRVGSTIFFLKVTP